MTWSYNTKDSPNSIKNHRINEFIKVAGSKIVMQKSVEFLYANSQWSEIESKKKNGYKCFKYLGIYLKKWHISPNTKRWNNFPVQMINHRWQKLKRTFKTSCIRDWKSPHVRMSTLFQTICRFDALSIKIPIQIITEIKKWSWHLYGITTKTKLPLKTPPNAQSHSEHKEQNRRH
jgi:hypothetical protein